MSYLDNLTSDLVAIGKRAVRADKTLKPYAAVNPADKFALVAGGTANSAMLDEIARRMDGEDRRAAGRATDAFNALTEKPRNGMTQWHTLIMQACNEAHEAMK